MLALLAAAGGAAAEPECAYACSCMRVVATRDLPRADGAFVGELLFTTDEPAKAREVTLVFGVERVIKGTLGSRVEVRTNDNGAACGLEVRLGQRVGLLLERDGDAWRSGLCAQVAPAELVAAGEAGGYDVYSPLDEEQRLPGVNWGGIVIGALVLGLGALFLVRRLRRS